MKDYTQPPTEEFAMITNNVRHYRPYGWFTLLKSVLNDYYFDVPPGQDDMTRWADKEFLDHFMHKIYYCWQEHGKELYGDED